MTELPSDIWRHIAGFIPVAILLTLYSVNRTFLQVARENRYRAIDFVAYKSSKLLIKHIKCSPLVHSVRIKPWIVSPKEPRSSFWSPATWKTLNSCISSRSFDEDPDAQVARRLQKQVRLVTEAIRGLPNLHTYHIDWDGAPIRPEYLTALLDSLIPAIGHNLSTLSLKVPLHYMHSLPRLANPLSQLQSIAVTIHTASHVARDISEKMEGLVVFLNTLLRNLRSISIQTTPTSTYLDLGLLFAPLGRGRRLTSFTLYIPFDGGHLPNPKSLRKFLINHSSTLESLTLGTTRAAAHHAPSASTNNYWIRDAVVNHPPFPSLSCLSLALRPLRINLAPLIKCLTGMRPHLRMLKLTERALEYAELVRVLDALHDAPLLRVLSIRVRWLSPEVIDRLAATLPNLTVLCLSFAEVVHHEPAGSVCSGLSVDSYGLSRESELMLFFRELEGKNYSRWNLSRLAVPECPRGQMKWLDAMGQAFVRCIPGLMTFEELVSTV
ncbi:hypothetical protein GGX14DRAFT_424167 [Mycena pura]|uniref:F-box domain-containing protein n=1 Tax=Mycena pura TaxID=153505 RepID=A0AAD6YMW3_9AGAR|nr:hypothetical protein GGX14DRAFT_424167 [Mycena pura]